MHFPKTFLSDLLKEKTGIYFLRKADRLPVKCVKIMMEQTNRLTDGPLKSSLLKFTLPFLFSNLLQTLYGTVDTLVVGNFGSTAGISAVATGAQALSLVTFFIFGLAGGSTVLLGQFVGAKDQKNAASVVGNTIIDFGLLSLIMTFVMFFAHTPILHVLNIPEDALGEAQRYMKVCIWGIPLITGYNIVSAMLNAIGDSKSPLLFVGIACVINIAGDLLLTGVFHMGAMGVAFATVTAQGCSFLFALFYLMKKGLPFPFSAKAIRFGKKMTFSIAKIGIPMGVQSILINVSFLFMTSLINSMGVIASASMGIGDKIIGFAFMPQTAFSASSAVVVAQNVGAHKTRRAWDAVLFSMMVCLGIETFFFLICQIFPGFFPGLFSHDPQVIELAGLYMRAYSIDAILTAMAFCLSGYLNGNGRTAFNMTQNLITTFLCRVPAAYLLAALPNSNLFMIGLAAPLATLISNLLLVIYIRKMHKTEPLY